MPHAKFGPDPLTTVAVHNYQRNRQTNRLSFTYMYKIIIKIKTGFSFSSL